MASAMGLIRVASNSDLMQQEQREAAYQAAYESNLRPQVQGLAKYVMDCWEDARTAKQAVLPRLQRAQRARLGVYDPHKLAAIDEFGGSNEYARITANKCRVVEAWLRDVFLGQTAQPWTLNPTPKPDFPPEQLEQIKQQVAMEVAGQFITTGQMPDANQVRTVIAALVDVSEERIRDEARKATQRMERKMQDQLVQGGFPTAMGDFLADLVTYPAAIMKGPVLRRRKQLTWKEAEGGQLSPTVEDAIAPEFERIDPFRAYPSAGSVSPQDGYFIEHLTYSYQDLYELIGAPGFNEDAIRAVLSECDHQNGLDWLGFVNEKEDDTPDATPRTLRRKVFNIDCLEFHGPVRGKDLIEWGVEGIDDPDASYESCVWLIANWVIKAQINYDPLGKRPYYKTSYEELPGDFWGFGIPDVLDDMQGIANAAVRSLVNNMAMASGPQVGVNVDRLAAGAEITRLKPWHVWQFEESEFGSTQKPIEFFQPNTNVRELLEVLEMAYRMADDFSLVPRYMAGSDKVGGAGRTASGLSMLMDAANKGLKGVVANVDLRVLSPMLDKLYAHNMIYEDDITIKGDAQVVARGAVSLMQLESLQLRRNEFLQVTANPIDSQIVGLPGRAEILREVAKGLDMDVSKIVPPREQLMAAAQMQQMAPPPQGAPAQPSPVGGGETLQNGAAVTDNFSPNSMTP